MRSAGNNRTAGSRIVPQLIKVKRRLDRASSQVGEMLPLESCVLNVVKLVIVSMSARRTRGNVSSVGRQDMWQLIAKEKVSPVTTVVKKGISVHNVRSQRKIRVEEKCLL